MGQKPSTPPQQQQPTSPPTTTPTRSQDIELQALRNILQWTSTNKPDNTTTTTTNNNPLLPKPTSPIEAQFINLVLQPFPAHLNVVRFFLSSTFTDTREERDAFIALCVPALRESCRKRGLEFQLSEMRWGISDSMSCDHLTTDLCGAELERCHHTSAATSFIGLIGNKYGYRPMPNCVTQTTFQALCNESAELKVFFDKWYRLDENTVPAVMRMLPIPNVIPGYTGQPNQPQSREWWADNYTPMRRLATDAARAVVKKKIVSDLDMRAFLQSVTEMEMRLALDAGQVNNAISPAQNHIIFFSRELVHGRKTLFRSSSSAKLPGDYEDNDDDSKQQVRKLRKFVQKKCSSLKIPWYVFREQWRGPIDSKLYPKYIKKFLVTMATNVERQITTSVLQTQVPEVLTKELYAHATLIKNKTEMYAPRPELDLILADHNHQQAFESLSRVTILHGHSGCGKTTLMAKVMHELARASPHVVLVCRFVGTTSHSDTAIGLLKTMTEQLLVAYEFKDRSVPETFNELVGAFRDVLEKGPTKDKPCVVVLDSLDQLRAGLDLKWLPSLSLLSSTAPYVKIILSTLPQFAISTGGQQTIMDILTTRIYPTAQVIEVKNLETARIDSVLAAWLGRDARNLTRQQSNAMIDTLTQCGIHATHLILRVLYTLCKTHRSYDEPPLPLFRTITDSRTAVTSFFTFLESRHAPKFLQGALSIISSARDGISVAELEDILSLNNDILDECFAYWIPPVARVPPLLTTRLLSDLQDFIAPDASLITWQHRAFREGASDLHATTDSFVRLARYFEGIEAQQDHSYTMSHAVRGEIWTLSRDRMVAAMPLQLGEGVWNTRKIRELAWAWMHAGKLQDAERVLMDIEFLNAAVNADLIGDVISQLDALAAMASDDAQQSTRCKLVAFALKQSLANLSFSPSCLVEQLWARLFDARAYVPLWQECDTYKRSPANTTMRIRAAEPTMSQATSPLKAVLTGHRNNVDLICIADDDLVVSGSTDRTIKIWNRQTGKLIQTIQGYFQGTVRSLAVDPVRRIILAGSVDTTIKAFGLDSYELLFTLPQMHSLTIYGLALFERLNKHLAISASKDLKAIVWDLESQTHVAVLEGHKTSINAVATSRDGSVIATATNTCVWIWKAQANDCNVWDRFGEVGQGDNWNCVAIYDPDPVTGHCTVVSGCDRDSARKIEGRGTGGLLEAWSSVTGESNYFLVGHGLSIRGITVIGTTNILSAGDDQRLRIWDIAKRCALRVIMGHFGSIRCISAVPGRRGEDCLDVATCSFDRTCRLWEFDAISKRDESMDVSAYLLRPSPLQGVAISKDRVLAAAKSGVLNEFWGTQSVHGGPNIITVQTQVTDRVNAMDADDDLVIIGTDRGIARVWRIIVGNNNQCGVELLCDLMHNEGTSEKANWVNDVQVFPKALCTAAWDMRVRLWSRTNGSLLWRSELVHNDSVLCLSSLVVVGGRFASGSCDKTLVLWKMVEDGSSTAAAHVITRLHGPKTRLEGGVAISEEGTSAAALGADGEVIVWKETPTGWHETCRVTPEASAGSSLRTLSTSRMKNMLVTGHENGVICAIEWRTINNEGKSNNTWWSSRQCIGVNDDETHGGTALAMVAWGEYVLVAHRLGSVSKLIVG